MTKSLKKQLAIYQHVIDAAPDIIHIISPEMRIILRNRRSREWFPAVKTGGRCFRWLHDTDKPCHHCSVQRVFQDGQRHEHESIIKGRNQGREIIVHSTASPIYDDDGQLLGALEILRDITERKQMEHALQETAERLSQANRLKGLLLRMVRHDLGTPVGAILNTTEYLLEEPEQLGEFLEDVEDIYQCSCHILQLIRDADVLSDVLTTSRLSFQDLDLTTLLADLILQLEPVMKQAGIQLENLLPRSLPLKGLPILKTVFENILVNGIKYGVGDGRLVLSATETDSHISVSITDFGPGIPDEHKKRIFQQFERLATDIPGTGLGLAIASQTVAPQDHSLATYFGGRRPADGEIDWHRSAEQILNLVRAVTRPYPGAFSYLGNRKVLFWSVSPVAGDADQQPGTVLSREPLIINCGQGAIEVSAGQMEESGLFVNGD